MENCQSCLKETLSIIFAPLAQGISIRDGNIFIIIEQILVIGFKSLYNLSNFTCPVFAQFTSAFLDNFFDNLFYDSRFLFGKIK